MIIYDIIVKVSLMGKNKAHEPEILNLNYTLGAETAITLANEGQVPIGNGILDLVNKTAEYDGRKYKVLNAISVMNQIKADIPKMAGIKELLEDLANDTKDTPIEIDPTVGELFGVE